MCGERDQHVRLDEKTDMGHNDGKAMERQFESVDDVLDTISGRVDVEKRFNIQISRTNILERGLLQWQRQKGSSPTATLNVTFFGEAGVDTGALRKEFLTEVVAGIEGRFFEGPQQQRIPRYSLNDLDSDLYRTVGEILAVSLAQGGPAPAFFSPWTYSYLCSGRINQKVLNSDSVADVQLRELIDQVESATEHSIIGLSDEILNCGYTGNVSIPNKDTIVRSIILHAVLRLQPMLEQLREGLQLYGLLSLMSQYPDICQPLFVSGEDVKVNAEFVMTSILPQLSDKGTTRHQVELEMMNFIQDFLYEAEDHGHVDKDGLHPITPATFLQWITGQGHVPLLPSEKKDFAVVIQFNHDCSADFGHHSVCYPVVTACAKTITLPVRHMRPYEKFKNILTEAFQLGQEFSNV
ncbi:G2/M phase-specific E3 ubiquitin-protein ligase-like [Trematomus bernacchii]|uniref:G2/M phase-specific E3 ubiquitin-protein ligase-like n=1 Tax=Trematomus bernacchii TaxID=40690 RepID=UPI001469AA98|nr:G2/M phase-specific E3 ubiquitin-protein ligase-like [Trematomus bernacchii]XP_033976853.1 G2/M phase-specific E3 ubiquitin-protein ligase-like [Trematomus bernacchii]